MLTLLQSKIKIKLFILKLPSVISLLVLLSLEALLELDQLLMKLVVLIHDPLVFILEWFLLKKSSGKTYISGLTSNLVLELVIHFLYLVKGLGCLQVIVEKLLDKRC